MKAPSSLARRKIGRSSAQDAQSRRRISRVHLRIERRNFYRHIYDWEELGVFAQRIGPAARFPGEMLK
jgi:hypothetical protein